MTSYTHYCVGSNRYLLPPSHAINHPPTHSLTHPLPPSLPRLLTHSLPPSLPPSFAYSPTPSLPPSLPHSLTHPLPPSLTHPLPHRSHASTRPVTPSFHLPPTAAKATRASGGRLASVTGTDTALTKVCSSTGGPGNRLMVLSTSRRFTRIPFTLTWRDPAEVADEWMGFFCVHDGGCRCNKNVALAFSPRCLLNDSNPFLRHICLIAHPITPPPSPLPSLTCNATDVPQA